MSGQPRPYAPMTLLELAGFLSAEAARVGGDGYRWRLVAEFLQEYSCEPPGGRTTLLADEPPATGDARWDVFLAALAEHLAAADGLAGPPWSETRTLPTFWFPFDTAAARVDAFVHAPAAFRRRGIFVSPHELKVA